MFLKKNRVILNKNCLVFFSNYESTLYLKGIFGLILLKLPSFYFFLIKINVLSFLFIEKFYFVSFYKHFLYLYKNIFNYTFVRLYLKGLGYRITYITSDFIRFFFNLTNFFYFHLPKDFLVSFKKNNLIILTHNLSFLKNVLSHLLLLKKLSVYRIRGLVTPRQIIYLKIGKKKV